MDGISLLKRVLQPIEGGESPDSRTYFDLLDDNVVLANSIGELHGKAAVLRYFADSGSVIEANPFVAPLRYLSEGNCVVVLGEEVITIKATGVATRTHYAWVHELRNEKITHLLSIQDLDQVADAIRDVYTRAQTG